MGIRLFVSLRANGNTSHSEPRIPEWGTVAHTSLQQFYATIASRWTASRKPQHIHRIQLQRRYGINRRAHADFRLRANCSRDHAVGGEWRLGVLPNLYGGLLQVLPSQMTFTKMNAVINPLNTIILTGVTDYRYCGALPVPAAGWPGQLVPVWCVFTFIDASTLQSSQPTQTYSYIVPPAELGVCSATFSVTIPAGDSLMWLISMTSSSFNGPPLTQSLNIDVSIAVAMR